VHGIFEPMANTLHHPFLDTSLNLPPADLMVRQEKGTWEVQCLSRKKWMKLEPEEWVRQHWISFLHHHLGYPSGGIAVELALKFNGMQKRADIVCHGVGGHPLVVVECKRPSIRLNQTALDQVLRYNIALQIPCMIVSNGLQHHAYALTEQGTDVLEKIPLYNEHEIS
jgi:hypothetical protein